MYKEDLIKVLVALEFAEWIGTEYEQDNGSVIGNVYYDRSDKNGQDYDIPELWEMFINEKNEEIDYCTCVKPWGVSGKCIVCSKPIKLISYEPK